MKKYLCVFLFCFSVLPVNAATKADGELWQKSTPITTEWFGTWHITHLLVDSNTSRKLLYLPDDPRVVGRFISISQEKITSELPEDTTCEQPHVWKKSTDINAMIKVSMPRLGLGDGEISLSDYGVQKPTKNEVDVSWISCKSQSFGPETEILGSKTDKKIVMLLSELGLHSWAINQNDGTKILSWYDQTLLVIERVMDSHRASASFSCVKATTKIEQAICASSTLSAFDMSVSKAYRLAADSCVKDTSCLGRLHKSQNAWIKKRNSCDLASPCLTEQMRSRLDELMNSATGAE